MKIGANLRKTLKVDHDRARGCQTLPRQNTPQANDCNKSPIGRSNSKPICPLNLKRIELHRNPGVDFVPVTILFQNAVDIFPGICNHLHQASKV